VADTPPEAGAAPKEAARTARAFSGDLGLLLMDIKPERMGDFDAGVAKLKEALAASNDPVRRRQAASWHVLKPAKPAAEGPVPVAFLLDPPVPGADYTVSRILGDAFPGQTRELFKGYSALFDGGVSLLNYTLVRDFRQ
jgi:hypothetical protein